MITEEHLDHILKEMDYQLLGLAKEVAINNGETNVTVLANEQVVSINYLQEKIIMLKHHIDWIRVDMQMDGA